MDGDGDQIDTYSGGGNLRRDILWVSAVAIVYFIIARLSLFLSFAPEGIAAIWPPAGIFLSALLLTRPQLRPWMAAALFVTDVPAEVLAGTPLDVSVIYAGVLTADASLSIWLLRRFVGEPISFRRLREVIGWLLLSVMLSNGVVAVVAAAAAATFLPGTVSFSQAWQWWAASDGVGNMLITPFVLTWAAWFRDRRDLQDRPRMLEEAAMFGGAALAMFALFNQAAAHPLFVMAIPYVVFPFLLWAALRVGQRGVSTVLVVLAGVAVPLVAAGRVPSFSFAPGMLDDVIVVQLVLASWAVPSLVLAALVRERREAMLAQVASAAARRESERKLHDIMASLDDWVWEVDQNGVYTFSSAQGYELFGDVVGKTPFDLMPPDESRRVGAIFSDIAARKAPIKNLGNWNITRSGEPIYLLTNGVPILDADGNLKGYRGVDRDITDRQRSDEERAALNAQLQQAQKMESVGRLAGGVAHDFNNMLSVILGNAELALGRLHQKDALRVELKEIYGAAQRSADLTRQLLAFARRQTVVPKVLDLNEAVTGMLKMLQRLIGEDINLRWQPKANLWPVRVDPSQIDQILANLCVNARDAIAGTGTLTLETGQSTFTTADIATSPDVVPGDYVMLSVSDDGSGMDAATLLHLFEPFFTTKATGSGTGLGLATVYGIVKQNNGFINVQSEPSRGTTFRIYLPRDIEAAEKELDEGAGKTLPRGDETILLVEDEPSILTLTARMLASGGYRVLSADTPGEAVRLAKEHQGAIHLLVTDVVMPGMNGRDLSEALLPLHPKMVCLFVSGYTADVIAHRGVLDDGVQFLQKPFSVDGLLNKVRETLDSQALKRA